MNAQLPDLPEVVTDPASVWTIAAWVIVTAIVSVFGYLAARHANAKPEPEDAGGHHVVMPPLQEQIIFEVHRSQIRVEEQIKVIAKTQDAIREDIEQMKTRRRS